MCLGYGMSTQVHHPPKTIIENNPLPRLLPHHTLHWYPKSPSTKPNISHPYTVNLICPYPTGHTGLDKPSLERSPNTPNSNFTLPTFLTSFIKHILLNSLPIRRLRPRRLSSIPTNTIRSLRTRRRSSSSQRHIRSRTPRPRAGTPITIPSSIRRLRTRRLSPSTRNCRHVIRSLRSWTSSAHIIRRLWSRTSRSADLCHGDRFSTCYCACLVFIERLRDRSAIGIIIRWVVTIRLIRVEMRKRRYCVGILVGRIQVNGRCCC